MIRVCVIVRIRSESEDSVLVNFQNCIWDYNSIFLLNMGQVSFLGIVMLLMTMSHMLIHMWYNLVMLERIILLTRIGLRHLILATMFNTVETSVGLGVAW